MNSLSWLLYAAEVADSLKTTIGVSFALGGFVLVFSWVPFVSEHTPRDWANWLATLPRKFGWLVVLMVLALVAIPSKTTFMLIAASEVGESVIASDQVQEIGGEAGALATDSLRVLRKIINEQLGAEE